MAHMISSKISCSGPNIIFLNKPLIFEIYQGSHRLEKYLNIQDCLKKSLKIKFAMKST